MERPPLAEARYVLSACTLRCLDQEDAAVLGPKLAAMDPWRTLGYRAEALTRYLLRQDPGLQRYAVEADTRLEGVVCTRYPWLCGPYLELLALLPTSQGRGLGQQILLWLEQQTRATANNLWTTVSSFNLRARSFYLRCGYVEIAPLANLVRIGYDEILLRKDLGSMENRFTP
jgi:diamine N-acetyltransferase